MQTYLNKSETAWLYETKKWFSLYIRWECITSWISKEKITDKVIWSLDELDRVFVEGWKKWSDKAYEKFYELLNEREETEENDFDDDIEVLDNNAVVWSYNSAEEVNKEHWFEMISTNRVKTNTWIELETMNVLNKEEAEAFVFKLRRKWMKMRKDWKEIKEIYETLKNEFDAQDFSMKANKLFIWIVWVREIKFFSTEWWKIDQITNITFEENIQTKEALEKEARDFYKVFLKKNQEFTMKELEKKYSYDFLHSQYFRFVHWRYLYAEWNKLTYVFRSDANEKYEHIIKIVDINFPELSINS